MPILISYLLKLSCSLAVVFLFYQFALRPLTFYNTNRWYLLGYSLLSFFIPFINIAHLMQQHQLERSRVVQAIPLLENYTSTSSEVIQQSRAALNVWDAGLLLFAFGVLVLSIRLLLQYLSLRRLSRTAQLLTEDGIKMYQVNKEIVPFSFGNAIFINQHLHSEAELKEIIRHEFVHVRQRHTIDILFTEMLCILNWYNPAAWAIRNAVRQNLEFIADNQVLQSGFDKKEYQYLLLKVMGLPQFRITTPFNLSALKKRIIMMNKMKSAKAHLVKFLFMLPLLSVLLVAFRNVTDHVKIEKKKGSTFTVSGMVVDAATQTPLTQVTLQETYSKATATTDNRGYFSMVIPVEQYPLQTQVFYSKDGFGTVKSSSVITVAKLEPAGTIEIVGMTKNSDRKNRWFVQSFDISANNPAVSAAPTYDEVLKNVRQIRAEQQKHAPKAGQKMATDTVPAPPPPPPAVAIVSGPSDSVELPDDYKDFLARHPDVAGISWSDRDIIIELKSGKKESYPRNDAKRMAEATRKWGALPAAPPPPPPPPTVTPPKEQAPDTRRATIQQQLEHKQQNLANKNNLLQQNRENQQAQQRYLKEQQTYITEKQQYQQEQNVQLKKEQVQLQANAKQEKAAEVQEQKRIAQQQYERRQVLLQEQKDTTGQQ